MILLFSIDGKKYLTEIEEIEANASNEHNVSFYYEGIVNNLPMKVISKLYNSGKSTFKFYQNDKLIYTFVMDTINEEVIRSDAPEEFISVFGNTYNLFCQTKYGFSENNEI